MLVVVRERELLAVGVALNESLSLTLLQYQHQQNAQLAALAIVPAATAAHVANERGVVCAWPSSSPSMPSIHALPSAVASVSCGRNGGAGKGVAEGSGEQGHGAR